MQARFENMMSVADGAQAQRTTEVTNEMQRELEEVQRITAQLDEVGSSYGLDTEDDLRRRITAWNLFQ